MDGTMLVHEVHDMWPCTPVELGHMSKRNPFIRVMQKAEDSAYRNCDALVSMPPFAERYMNEHGLSEGKFNHIPNGVVLEEWEHPADLPDNVEKTLSELKNAGKFIVGYFGGHALSNALDTLLDSAKLLRDQGNIVFVLVGDGVEKTRLQERCQKEHIANVTFLPLISKSAIPNLLKWFDCSYIGAGDSPLYRFGVSMNKLYDSMMGAKPVILSIKAPSTLVEECKCGIVVPPEEPEAVRNAIVQICQMSVSEREVMGERGKKVIEEVFNYKKLSDDFCKVMGKGKNILLINHYAGSKNMGMEFRPYYFAREWIKRGYRVDIIAADYSHLRRNNPVIEQDFQEEIVEGIHYHWVHTVRYGKNGVKRALSMFEFVGKLWINAKKIAKDYKPDVIITSSTYPLDTYAGQRIRKYSGGGYSDS